MDQGLILIYQEKPCFTNCCFTLELKILDGLILKTGDSGFFRVAMQRHLEFRKHYFCGVLFKTVMLSVVKIKSLLPLI